MTTLRSILIAAAMLLLGVSAFAAEVIPPAPTSYFTDNAAVVSATTARDLNAKLQQFERDTSNQVLVVIYPKMQSDSSIEDYTQRVAQKWKVGQPKLNNGAVLFVFVQDRTLFMQVGYGLEGALPDATAKNIIDTQIIPKIRANDWDGAMRAGVASIMAATRGEYKGTGRTVGGGSPANSPTFGICAFVGIMILVVIFSSLNRSRGYGYGGMGPFIAGGLLGSAMRGGRGGWGGGGSFGGGGGGGFGGFSGGGGSFGGGGAGGRW